MNVCFLAAAVTSNPLLMRDDRLSTPIVPYHAPSLLFLIEHFRALVPPFIAQDLHYIASLPLRPARLELSDILAIAGSGLAPRAMTRELELEARILIVDSSTGDIHAVLVRMCTHSYFALQPEWQDGFPKPFHD